jgi:hypothetical protein
MAILDWFGMASRRFEPARLMVGEAEECGVTEGFHFRLHPSFERS